MSQTRSSDTIKALNNSTRFFSPNIGHDQAERQLRRFRHTVIPAMGLVKKYVADTKCGDMTTFLKERNQEKAKDILLTCGQIFNLLTSKENIAQQIFVFQYVNTNTISLVELYEFFGNKTYALNTLFETCKRVTMSSQLLNI